MATAMRHPPLFAAGTQWSYSNTNYLVVGMLIERVTGHRWHSEVRSRILVPLHLTRTFYPGDQPTLPQPHAEGYGSWRRTGTGRHDHLQSDRDGLGRRPGQHHH